MNSREEELLARLRATFRDEAADHLQAIADGLLELEKAPSPGEPGHHIDSIFRAAHSLKGAARAVNFSEIESICQSLEDVFASWRRDGGTPSASQFDSLHRKIDSIVTALAAPEAASATAPGSVRAPATPQQDVPVPARVLPAGLPVGGENTPVIETVRIPVAALDRQLLEAEELLTAKLTAGQRAAELRDLGEWFESWSKEWASIQASSRALRQTISRAGSVAPGASDLTRVLDFCDWNCDRVKALESRIAALTQRARQDHHAVGKLVDDLLEDAKRLSMLPFASVAAALPRAVRDLCREQGKEARLVIRGEDTAVDKRVLEEMKDPLIHLLRNCVDHGIEPPARRAALGKPPSAAITVAISPINGDKIELLVSDDGAGIDAGRVSQVAVSHGLISADEARTLDVDAALGLIFRADVSTSPIITRVSGRGLGLAIVRENTERIGGRITVESRPGEGTTFRIVLPVTVATARGVTVTAAQRTFVLPSRHVERVTRVKREDVQTVENRETISLGGRAIALARLADTLELPGVDGDEHESSPAISVVVLSTGEQRMAFAVDAVLGEQEVLMKRIARPLSRVRNIAGATVLGSGQVVPILNVTDLLKSARRNGSPKPKVPSASPVPASSARPVLVVEDSITSRMLLKVVLEAAGYLVKTAVDGADALTLLKTEPFELVVSDVEMPRMNGFDLTRAIRADRRLAELPVVLVTALETREDREHGIDAGANAYLVKSNFDQGTLIETVRRFI